MRRIFSPFIHYSISNPKSLSDLELIIIFHQLRHIFLRKSFSNLIPYKDTYSLQYLLNKLCENHVVNEKNLFMVENEKIILAEELPEKDYKKDNSTILKSQKLLNNYLERNIKDIDKENEIYKDALVRYYKNRISENSNLESYFEYNFISVHKIKDIFYRDYCLKINVNDQKFIEIREHFKKKNGLSNYRDYFQNFLGVFDSYKNLLSSVYFCEKSKIKASPPEYDKLSKFHLPHNFFIFINYNNINFIDSKLDVLFSINYSDLVYVYHGEENEVLIGICFTLDDPRNINEKKNSKTSINHDKQYDSKETIRNKKENSFELLIRLFSNESRLIVEDIISYSELILAIHTNSDLTEHNDKSIFKRLNNLEVLETMNSYSINSNLINSIKSNTPFDIKNYQFTYQKKLPFTEKYMPDENLNINIEDLLKNEAIEELKSKKNIHDINKNYNPKSILNDLFIDLYATNDSNFSTLKRTSTLIETDVKMIRKISEANKLKRTNTLNNKKNNKRDKDKIFEKSDEDLQKNPVNYENMIIPHVDNNLDQSKTNNPPRSNLNRNSRSQSKVLTENIFEVTRGNSIIGSYKRNTINKPQFKEIEDDKNNDNSVKKDFDNRIQKEINLDNNKIIASNEASNNDESKAKKSVFVATNAANQAMALLPKSIILKKKPTTQNSIIPPNLN